MEAGGERATEAQTALAQREQQTQAKRREEEAALTTQQKTEPLRASIKYNRRRFL